MLKELDTVVLTEDLAQHGLKRGDVGTVVGSMPSSTTRIWSISTIAFGCWFAFASFSIRRSSSGEGFS